MTLPIPAFNAAAAALTAAIPSARGWFRFGTSRGGVNVRLAGAVQAVLYDDQRWRIIALGATQPYDLALGPFDDGDQAAEVADAVLRLAYNDLMWPTASLLP